MIILDRCDSSNEKFVNLCKFLDEELVMRNGKKQDFYNKYNLVDYIDAVIILKEGNLAVGCGGFKPYDSHSVEIKRMYVKEGYRGKHHSTKILEALEAWAVEMGYKKALLETGCKQIEAIGLYQSAGYHKIDNYGQYIGVENSICFAKNL